MKIIHYCQHVLGIGHFFRSLEICRALEGHEVILVTGGSRIGMSLPNHVRAVQLPGLMMDRDFTRLFPAGKERSIDQVKTERRQRLGRLFEKERPDLFLVELYPFGRKAFRFELDPVLDRMRERDRPPGRVICSLRDILVEKQDAAAYESRVVKTLNRYFDAVLVHADPALVKLDETFARIADIEVPIVYTGFVTPKPARDARGGLRTQLGIGRDDVLIVASAGGGTIGEPLLEAVIKAFQGAAHGNCCHLQVFTGPFMAQDAFERLRTYARGRVQVSRFTSEFLSYLAAADLSVSMAGYNTCMNILAAKVPALVWPFSQNREQRLRAERLAALGAVEILDDEDLQPDRLAAVMQRNFARRTRPAVPVDLDGAANTARWIEERGGPLFGKFEHEPPAANNK